MKEEDEIRKMKKEIKTLREGLKEINYVFYIIFIAIFSMIYIHSILTASGFWFIALIIGFIALVGAGIFVILMTKYEVDDIKIKSKIKIIKLYDD